MKKTKIARSLLIMGLAYSTGSFGQGIYLGVDGGMGFAAARMSGSNVSSTDVIPSSGPGTSTFLVTTVKYSFGKGVPIGIYGGYMFNKNVGAEIGIGYLIGSTTTLTYNYSSTEPGISNTDNSTETMKGRMLRITPAIRLQAGEGKIHPYMTAGLIIGMASKMTDETVRTQTNSNSGPPSSATTTVTDQIWVYSGGLSMGFHGALGLNYSLSDKLGIFGELTGNYMNWSPGKKLLTTATSNGADQLGAMHTIDKETDYSSSYTTSSNPPSTGSPLMATTVFLPFSSFGFTLGIHLTLGGK